MRLHAINPATGTIVKTFAPHTRLMVEAKLARGQKTFALWSGLTFAQRAAHMHSVAITLRAHQDTYAKLMAQEMGKPIAQGRREVEKCAWTFEHYATHAEAMLRTEHIALEAKKASIRYEPLGVILAVMPWNFPFWQALRAAAPTLMAGNVLVLKHASNVPQCALALEQLFKKAKLPNGVFQTILVGADRVESIIADSRVKAVTFTGSTAAGCRVAEAAGRYIKKVVLELGGSDPCIVLADAPLPHAASIAAKARLLNSGQSCVAAKRFIVVKDVAQEFLRHFVEGIKNAIVGDPMDPTTEVGPLARKDLQQEVHRQVQTSIAQGAKLICGGHPIKGKGYFYAPTVLTNVTKGMPAYEEEIFGPVASVIIARNEDDAIRIANDTVYGLGASIWTRDIERAQLLSHRIQAGVVSVNDLVASDPRLPFGGVKQSGYGRELGNFGIKEFVNIKTVVTP